MMKKIIFVLFLSVITTSAFAQPVSKKGEAYLPREGDWAVGIDAAPFLRYLGNFFSEAENPAPFADYTNDRLVITAKKFVKDDMAYRAGLRLNVFSDKNRSFSPEFSVDPTNTTVEDSYGRTFTNFTFSVGVEKRKGNTRVQGFYGAEAFLGIGTESHKFEYGNEITQENTNPDRTQFDLLFQDDPREITNISETGAFMKEFNKGVEFSAGARAFLGAEFFILPKMSLGFEYGFALAFAYTGNSEIVEEQWAVPVGGDSEQFVTTVTDEGGSSTFNIDNDITGGSLFFTLYF
ncbi:MAG: hypothetical protein MK086_10390 [Flavobacteriales bacterium]|nr:hypothetical protein [Flavobacteriales bacterium]